jgi:hypothetical protein
MTRCRLGSAALADETCSLSLAASCMAAPP